MWSLPFLILTHRTGLCYMPKIKNKLLNFRWPQAVFQYFEIFAWKLNSSKYSLFSHRLVKHLRDVPNASRSPTWTKFFIIPNLPNVSKPLCFLLHRHQYHRYKLNEDFHVLHKKTAHRCVTQHRPIRKNLASLSPWNTIGDLQVSVASNFNPELTEAL